MVSATKQRRIICTLVRVTDGCPSTTAPHNRLIAKPSALVPWADPYIAGLVRRLQSEVRMERARLECGLVDAVGNHSAIAELEPPGPVIEPDWDWWETPHRPADAESVD